MAPLGAFIAFHTGAFDFNGRANRGAFWWSRLLTIATTALALGVFVPLSLSTSGSLLSPVLVVLLLAYLGWFMIATVSISIRRLRDAGFSGWLYLIVLLPLGGLVTTVLYVFPTDPRGNGTARPRGAPLFA